MSLTCNTWFTDMLQRAASVLPGVDLVSATVLAWLFVSKSDTRVSELPTNLKAEFLVVLESVQKRRAKSEWLGFFKVPNETDLR